MDPIRPNVPPPNASVGPTPGQGAVGGNDFKLSASQGTSQGIPSAGATEAVAAPQAAGVTGPQGVEQRITGWVQEAQSRGLVGDSMINHVVGKELEMQFGPAATPAMREAVASQFRTDPALMMMFNRITSQP